MLESAAWSSAAILFCSSAIEKVSYLSPSSSLRAYFIFLSFIALSCLRLISYFFLLFSYFVFKADLYNFTILANRKIFITLTVRAAALEAFEFLMIMFSCSVEPPLLE